MFHGRTLTNYKKDSDLVIKKNEEIIFNLFYFFNKAVLIKIFFEFCKKCKGFSSAKNILENLKTIFTNIYCVSSNRVHNYEIPPKEVEILGLGFRKFYSYSKFPTKEVLNFQVQSSFKLTILQLLLQILRFHQGPDDKELFNIINTVKYFIIF